MKLKYINITLAIIILLILAYKPLTAILATEDGTNSPAWPNVQNTSSNDQDTTAIKLVLGQSYAANADGNQKGDTSKYKDVYINHPKVPLNTEQQEFVVKVKEKHKIQDASLDSMGWLAFKEAQFIDLQNGRKGLAEQQAKQGEKPLTAQDVTSIPAVNVPNEPPSEQLPSVSLEYKEIKIDGEFAQVWYDDGSAEAQAFLVKTEQGWRIAGIRAINIHF